LLSYKKSLKKAFIHGTMSRQPQIFHQKRHGNSTNIV
jgi:hypothetical protein